jgi:hypothetical protein
VASQKAIRTRLEQIKARAAEENARSTSRSNAPTGWDLAEEAAGLALELAEKTQGRRK